MSQGIPRDGLVNGRPLVQTSAMPSAVLVGGPWSEMFIGLWGSAEIALDPYSSFTSAVIGMRVLQSVDVGCRHPAAFTQATSIT
jgi:hypothetical protein